MTDLFEKPELAAQSSGSLDHARSINVQQTPQALAAGVALTSLAVVMIEDCGRDTALVGRQSGNDAYRHKGVMNFLIDQSDHINRPLPALQSGEPDRFHRIDIAEAVSFLDVGDYGARAIVEMLRQPGNGPLQT
ncbi:hypothetical protein LXM94_23670 [Rhizobium sp. TRM95111]|uniref:hypothetical protein n=1 Tax=Rhizobium alarense TaxID=2846851 RepID=UPI001F3C1A70|nr:hypothetical protein [Rhizobium alarense]MCF3642966.1 hypothetical protein [Rhizobium alarense]